ncbi:scavenger receptor cysteine-rich domain superfamily protein-like [Amphiura filiformis]|uniref:scavenger receptor cysteine-rich domain superfamily protein-like n=1 Tax=Amphiura filiformis TaxID=82378 RepID=UPI003B2220ED
MEERLRCCCKTLQLLLLCVLATHAQVGPFLDETTPQPNWGEYTTYDYLNRWSVQRSDDGAVRLVDGSSPSEGRVEVLYGGRWGTICDDGWDINDAKVVCRQLGFADANATRCCGHFSHGIGSIFLDDLSCVGTEEKISDCNHRGWEQHNCAHTEDAGVICVDKIRVSDGPTSLEGRVELFYNNTWGTICDQGWDRSDADVVCRQLGFPSANSSKSAAFYGEGSTDSPSLLKNVQCVGNETGVENCPHDPWSMDACEHSRDAGVVCTRPIRLRNGMSPLEGRVEIFNGSYGLVCDQGWDFYDAVVVCKQLGNYAAVEATTGSQFTPIGLGPQMPIMMNNVRCGGNEDTLEQCGHDGWGKFNDVSCRGENLAGVKCAPSVKLTDGDSHIDGFVEVYNNGEWGVCGDKWDRKDAQVACRQLGNYPLDSAAQATGTATGNPPIIGNIQCTGNETSLQECRHDTYPQRRSDCGDSGFAKATCQATVRLKGGSNPMEGNVEVLYEGQWGAICDDSWDINDAEVVCRQLGNYEAVSATCCSKFGAVEETILLDDVNCEGSESRIEDCYHGSWGSHNCGSSESAGVVCRVYLGLTLIYEGNPGSSCCKTQIGSLREGLYRLTKDGLATNLPEGRSRSHITAAGVKYACDGWDLNDADVLCRQLYNSTVDTIQPDTSSPVGRGFLTNFTCTGNEQNIFDCPHEPWGDYECKLPSAGVKCKGGLRLVGGRNELEGRVEVFHDGQWGTICDDNWDENDARVVCRQHGNYEVLAAKCCAAFGQGSGPILLDGMSCTGRESALEECPSEGWGSHNCQHYEDSSVICTDLKLTFENGTVSTNTLSGRVELLRDGKWGTVCSDGWDMDDAEVVCQQLYNTSAMEATKYKLGSGSPISTYNVKCTSKHKLLKDCPTSPGSKCKSGLTAAVNCKDIRLVGGPPNQRATGVIEILFNNQWGSICSDNWSAREGTVACKQLGYCGLRSAMKGLEVPRSGTTTMHWQKVNCTGTETRLRECDYKTGSYGCNGAAFEAAVMCRDACDFPGKLRHGQLTPNQTYYDIGGTVDFECTDKGFELIGNKTLTCLGSCMWTGEMPECQRTLKGASAANVNGSTNGAGMFIGGLILGIIVVIVIVGIIVIIQRRRSRSRRARRALGSTPNSIWKPKGKPRDDMEEPVLSFNSKHDGMDDGMGDTL